MEAIYFFLALLTNEEQLIDIVHSFSLSSRAAVTWSVNSESIFVIDKSSNEIDRYDNIRFKKKIGGKGWGNYEFDEPTDVWSSFLLEIFVTDKNNHRIQKYDKSLNYIQTIDENSIAKLEGRFYPLACATSSHGDLYVVESDGHRILKTNQRNQVEKEIGTFRDGEGSLTEPVDITIAGDDEIFVLDKSTFKIFDRFGNFVRSISLPSDGDWKRIQSSTDKIILTSSSSIMFFDLNGIPIQTILKTSIIGLNSNEEFMDAAISADQLLVLTPTTLYRCTLP